MSRLLAEPYQVPRSSPRFLLHSGGARHLARAIDFYRPVTARARVARAVLTAALRMGGARVVHLVGAPVPLETTAVLEAGVEQLRDVLGESIKGVVGGHGAPGPDRKVTLVALSEDALPLAFAKVSAGPDAARAVRSEGYALDAVAELALGVEVPRLLRRHAGGGHEVVVMAVANGVPPRSDSPLDPGRLAFLRHLAEVPRTGLVADIGGGGTALSHGDFTPWNCLYADGSLSAVIDWEELAWRAPGYDAIHHEVQRRVHFSYARVEEHARDLLREIPALLAVVAPGHDAPTCLREYCVATLNAAGKERWTEQGVELRHALLHAISEARAG